MFSVEFCSFKFTIKLNIICLRSSGFELEIISSFATAKVWILVSCSAVMVDLPSLCQSQIFIYGVFGSCHDVRREREEVLHII